MQPLKQIPFRTVVKYLLITLSICILIGYTLFQARLIIIGPLIELTNTPPSAQTVRVVELQGHAKNIVKITLNNRAIYTDKNGYFKEALANFSSGGTYFRD